MESKEEKTNKKTTGEKVKRFFSRLIWILCFLVVIICVVFGWGLYNLLQDDVYLFVTQNRGVAKAATYYIQSSDTETIVNIEPYPALNSLSKFHEAALSDLGRIDRMLVFDLDVIDEFTTEPLTFRDTTIPKEKFIAYLDGSEPIPAGLRADDVADWETRSHMLGNWVKKYNRDVIGTAAINHKRVAQLYRDGKIKISKQNGALFLLKFLPLENLIIVSDG